MSLMPLHNLRSPRRFIALSSLLYFLVAIGMGIATGLTHTIAMNVVLMIFLLVVLRHVVLFIMAVWPKKPGEYVGPLPFVSIIMPAYNEDAVIEAALDSLINLDYPKFEIIVVDDGSTDKTLIRARNFAKNNKKIPILVLNQSNSGKASALNVGIKHARGAFVLCVDSDSRLRVDAIRQALPYFNDYQVAAVGGAVEVANDKHILSRFQQLEYRTSLNFTRRALSHLGAVTVVPGPVGMFRRTALLEVGGYDDRRDMFAEDADLTVRLLSHGWHVAGSVQMVAYTEAPEKLYDLLRQRYRWKRGLFQAFDANYFALITMPGFRGIGVAAFLALECFLLDVLNFGLLLFFISYVIFNGGITPMLSAYMVLVGMDISVLLFICRDTGSYLISLLLLLIQRFSYAQILQVWAILALFDEWRSTSMDWDKLERHGLAT